MHVGTGMSGQLKSVEEPSMLTAGLDPSTARACETVEHAGRSAGHMRQMDTLRTIAVAMVIVSHWAHKLTTPWFSGFVGVQLFFVISGFLITGILLDARSQAETTGFARTSVLKNFYIRRFLRIFPLFYATLAITYLVGFPEVRASLWWHVPYLSNAFFATRGAWLGDVSHFWSLAVEEQFYLVWPWLMLFTPRRLLLPLIASVVVFAPTFRQVCYSAGVNGIAVAVMPFSSMDALGLGSMLALLQRNEARGQLGGLRFLAITAVVGSVVFCGLNIAGAVRNLNAVLYAVLIALVPLAALGLVWLAASGLHGMAGRIMELSPLVYLGRISYGLYIFHGFVPTGTGKIFHFLRWPVDALGSKQWFALNLVVLIGAASLTWHFFEKPINDLKRFFPYREAAGAERRGLGFFSLRSANTVLSSHE